MSRLFIDSGDEVDEIAWTSYDGQEKFIVNNAKTICIHAAEGMQSHIYKEDIPKLMKALEKAKELGWWA